MKALLVKDELYWGNRSIPLGKNLKIKDSTFNMLLFEKDCAKRDIVKTIGKAPKNAYQLLEVEEAPESDCEFLLDSGVCYHRIH